jgi:hypothetical protein
MDALWLGSKRSWRTALRACRCMGLCMSPVISCNTISRSCGALGEWRRAQHAAVRTLGCENKG